MSRWAAFARGGLPVGSVCYPWSVRSLNRTKRFQQVLGPFRLNSSSAFEGTPARIAVAGAGWWSQGWHLPQLNRNPNATVVAIVEPSSFLTSTLNPDMEQREQLAARYHCPIFHSIDDLLASGVPLDGLLVASNHASHFDIGRKGLAAGLHVMIEKPMTTDPVQALQLKTLAEAASAQHGRELVVMINNTANWQEEAKRVFDIVQSGRLGKVQHVSAFMGSPLLWLFDDPANEGWVKPSNNMTGNGFGWGQLSHTLAWVFKVTSLVPTNVFAFMGYSDRTGADLYDSATIMCHGGATISVQGVATLPGKNPVSSKQIENKIFGSEGFLEYSGDDLDPNSGGIRLRRHDGQIEDVPGFRFEDYAQSELGPASLQAFVDVCRGVGGVWNGCDVALGAMTVITIDAMYKSAASGAPVPVSFTTST